FFANRHQSFSRPLAEDAYYASVLVELRNLQAYQLRYPQPARVQRLQHRAIPYAKRCRLVRRREQCFNVFLGQAFRQRPRQLWRFDLERRIGADASLTQQVPVEAFQARKQTCRRAWPRVLLKTMREIGEQIGALGLREGPAAPLKKPVAELPEIAAIRVQRVARQAVLEPQRIAELVEKCAWGGSNHERAPSCASSQCLISIPRPRVACMKPPIPRLPTTRWQGITRGSRFAPQARPTGRGAERTRLATSA